MPQLTVEHFLKLAEFRPRQSILEIHNKDPKYAYRLVENTPEAIRYRQQYGYEIVTEGPEKAGEGGSPDQRQLIASGELVVMRRPIEIHELDVKARKIKAREKALGPAESFKTKAARLGVEAVDESKLEVAPLRSKAPSVEEFDEDDDA